MNGFIRLLILSSLITVLTSCASQPVDDELAFDGSDSTEAVAADTGGGGDDFAEFEESNADSSADSGESVAQAPADNGGDQDLAIEDEFNDFSNGQEQAAQPPPPAVEEPAAEEDPFADNAVADAPAPVPEPEIPAMEPEPAPAPMEPQAPVAETLPPAMPEASPATITDLQFRANDSGGTIIIRGDHPLTYTTRINPDLQQFVIEVENAILPDRLKRSLNTKDIKGSIGAVDAYQNPGSNVARFVIQLREGVGEPAVQMEGNSLLVVANGLHNGDASQEVAGGGGGEEGGGDQRILPSADLTSFLAGNTQFYGKKISIETNNMDVRDALNFITEESGVNMVLSEEVKGPISLKLRQVPWDQALVVIMKAKKLGYSRQGNVLRIAALTDLKAEEDDATKLAQSRRTVEPLKVRMFPVSYARVDDLEKKIKEFLGERGRVIGDTRTNALVVTDIEENLERAAKLIASLDTQPPQVLIEGKLVEAQEEFGRALGVSWNAAGTAVKLGSTSRGPVNLLPSFNINQGTTGRGALNFNLAVGTLDVLGNLSAALSLYEGERKVKVISSPRVMTLTNEMATINQTTEIPLRQVSQNGTSTIETFTYKPLTLKLEVTPQVTADGSVIMKMFVNRQIRGADAGADGSFPINSREANTRVLVKNGQTAVIGGIFQSDATESDTGVPWLKDMPVLGSLFKTNTVSRSKTELLVFVTPRIIAPTDGAPSPAVQEL